MVEVSFLTDEQIEKFQSDFKIVAKFFVNKRKNKDYIPDDKQTIQHVDELLKLLSVMTGDYRYEDLLNTDSGKQVKNMCEVADRLENRGMAKGLYEGERRKLISMVCRKLEKGKSVDEIVNDLDEEYSEISEIYNVAIKYAPNYDIDKIYKAMP